MLKKETLVSIPQNNGQSQPNNKNIILFAQMCSNSTRLLVLIFYTHSTMLAKLRSSQSSRFYINLCQPNHTTQNLSHDQQVVYTMSRTDNISQFNAFALKNEMPMKNRFFNSQILTLCKFWRSPKWGNDKSKDHSHRPNDPRKAERYDLSNLQGNRETILCILKIQKATFNSTIPKQKYVHTYLTWESAYSNSSTTRWRYINVQSPIKIN